MNKHKKESRLPEVLVYIIIIGTLVMVAPLVWRLADNYSFGAAAAPGGGERRPRERIFLRNYSVTQDHINISGLSATEYGAFSLLTAKVTNSGSVIMFLELPPERSTLGRSLQLAVWDGAHLNISHRVLRSGLAYSIDDGRYVYKDYGDGNIFISNDRIAFLFYYPALAYVRHYMLPEHLNIYQAVLSNNMDMLAIAAEEGFFISDAYPPSPGEPPALTELIASFSAGGVLITSREPVWSYNDEFIFYRTFAGEHVRNAGMTTVAPGGNQQLMALDSPGFKFIRDENNNDRIFYYFSSGTEPYQANLFRGGFFDPFGDRRMHDIIRSQVYYFDIAVSRQGRFLAALSHNGNMVRVILIDIVTKQQLHSALYDDVYAFSFSPDERGFIIYGSLEGGHMLSVINIDWEED